MNALAVSVLAGMILSGAVDVRFAETPRTKRPRTTADERTTTCAWRAVALQLACFESIREYTRTAPRGSITDERTSAWSMARMCASAAAALNASCLDKGSAARVRIATVSAAGESKACPSMGSDSQDATSAACAELKGGMQGLAEPGTTCEAVARLSRDAVVAVCSAMEKRAK